MNVVPGRGPVAHPSSEQVVCYVVLSSAAHKPTKCWGSYRRVAVLEVVPGAQPKMISERARGVVSIVQTWEMCSVGTTHRCAYRRAMAAAQELADRLNAERPAGDAAARLGARGVR